MLNQIIAVAGTIIAALIGFIAIVYNNARSNRHALELEKLRIGAEESKEESRRHIAAIEEAYQTLLMVDDLCTELAYDTKNPNNHNYDIVERIMQIRSKLQRVTTLIRIYLPDLGKDLEEYSIISGSYWHAIQVFHDAKCASLEELEIPHEKLAQSEFVYQKHLEKMFIKLEEHVQKK